MQTPTRSELVAACGAAAVAALLAIAAHSRWPYSYYDAFRWGIAICSVYTGYLLRSKPLGLAVCVATAVFFNPIAPLRMRAYQWQRYDTLAAIAMAGVSIYAWRLRATIAEPQSPRGS